MTTPGYKRGRFALRVDARTETELGTLQGRAQINFDWKTGNGQWTVPRRSGR